MTSLFRTPAASLVAALVPVLLPGVAGAATVPSPTPSPSASATTQAPTPIAVTSSTAPAPSAPASVSTPVPSGTATAAPAPSGTATAPASPAAPAAIGIRTITCVGTCPGATAFVAGQGRFTVSGTATGLPDGAGIALYRSIGGGAWTRVATLAVVKGNWTASDLAVTSSAAHRWLAAADGSQDAAGLRTTTSSSGATPALGLMSGVAVTRSPAVARVLGRSVARASVPVAPTPPAAPAPKPAPAVTLVAPATVLATAPSVTVTGTVRSASVARVRIQRLVGTAWVDLATVTPTSTGAFTWATGLGVNTLDALTLRAVATDATGQVGTSPVARTARVLPADAVRLTDAQARSIISSRGMKIWSSGGCTNRMRSNCTSFDTITTGVVRELVMLKQVTGCAITVSGGTEVGHATGTYSHYNGYKTDILMEFCLTSWVKANGRYIGAQKWVRATTTYYDEWNHWDLTVTS